MTEAEAKKKPTWGWLFNAVFYTMTVAVIVMEIWASVDGKDYSTSWTYLLLGHLKYEAVMALVGALVFWLPIHFWRRRNWKKSTS